jgi:GTP cyclohydrolase I
VQDSHRGRPRLTLVGRPASPGDTEPGRPHDADLAGTGAPSSAGPNCADTSTGWSTETGAAIDPGQVKTAATTLLTALNIQDLLGTKAAQMAHALTRMVTRESLVIRMSPNRADYEELIVSKGIGFRALCEEHMLPLSGVVHIGYIPHHFLMSANEPAQVLSYFARQPQSLQQLASQVAHWLDRQLQPRGVGVVVHADHTCDSDPGIFEPSVTVSSTLLGQVRDTPLVRTQFLSLTSNR